jgi:uncharacterized RDD family membrane protein YckC
MTELECATRMQRLAAVIIDGIIVLVVCMGLFILMGGTDVAVRQGFVAKILSMLLSASLFVGINWHLLSTRGQTVGKKLMGIKIVSTSGALVPVRDLLLRRYAPFWAAGLIPIVGPLVGLVNALFIFRADQRCVHDHIADTKVVRA